MKTFNWDRWVEQISKTEEKEISCSDCLDHISEYVDTELAGREFSAPLRHVEQHLGQCRVCREEYHVLRDLARLESEGSPPSIDDLKKSLG